MLWLFEQNQDDYIKKFEMRTELKIEFEKLPLSVEPAKKEMTTCTLLSYYIWQVQTNEDREFKTSFR